ncbi:MAG: response regulator [Rhodoferax sp.]|nr:response regulator [Rhodoferax sp.]
MADRLQQQSRAYVRNLLLGLLIVHLLVSAWVASVLMGSRTAHEDTAAMVTKNMATALDQTLSGTIGGVNLNLLAAVDFMEERLRAGRQLDVADVNTHLMQAQARLHYVTSLRATDSEGTVLYGAEVAPQVHVSWADREFFALLRADAEAGLSVTNPMYGTLTKRWILSFARRYNYPDGRFAGVVAASIPVEYFNEQLASLDIGPRGVAVLRDANLGLIARHPDSDAPADQLGATWLSPELAAAVASGQDTVTYPARNTADGIARINTYRRLTSVPFHLITGVGAPDYMASWYGEVRNSLAQLAVFMFMTALAAWLLYQSHAREQRDQLRMTSVLRGASDGIHVLDTEGKLLLANESFYQMLGRQNHDNTGLHLRDWDDSPNPASVGQMQAAMTEVLHTGKQTLVQTMQRRLDGSRLPVEVSLLPQEMDGQTVLFCSARDISDRLKAEAEVRQTQELMLAAIDVVDEAFVIFDQSDRLVYCNDNFRNLYATSADLLVHGEPFERIVRKGAERGIYLDAIGNMDAFVAGVVAAHQTGNQQALTRLSNGRIIRVVDKKLPNGSIAGFRIDVTELVEATSRAEQLARSKSRFLANMSHEIRTPMNAVLCMISLLQATPLSVRQQDYARKAESAAKSLLGLINDVLDYSKVESGKVPLECQPFSLEKLLRTLAVVLSATIKSRDMEVLFDVDADLPETLVGDGMRLQQILTNMGDNAVKFTSYGQVVIGIHALPAAVQTVRLAFTIQDSGIGIAPEHQQLVFGAFSQAEASTTRRFGGTGLGLAISKSLVESMGGTLHLVSTPDVGSTFRFELSFPLPMTLQPSANPIQPSALPSQQVLIVDDNPVAGHLLQKLVHSMGWTGQWHSTGSAALACVQKALQTQLEQFPFSLVLLKSALPDMDSWQLCQTLRQLAQPCKGAAPLVFMQSATGQQELNLHTASEPSLVDGLLVKPFTPAMLREALLHAKSGNTQPSGKTATRISQRPLAGMRILVVEDNLINQQVAEELLTAEGAIVSLAANGQLGVEAVRAAARQFDVVLMDIQMPVLDGYAATQQIRKELRLGLVDLPIVAMTANAMASDREACLAAGMNAHVGKPFDIALLVQLLLHITGFANADKQQAASWPSDARPVGARHGEARPEGARPGGARLGETRHFDGINLQLALSRMAGSETLYVRTARAFVTTLATLHTDLLQHLHAQDRKKLVMALHTLKGNAATVGLPGLAEQARQLEKLCASTADANTCQTALQTLAAAVDSARPLLEQAIAMLENAAPSPSPGLPHPTAAPSQQAMEAGLAELAQLLEQSNLLALDLFEQLRGSQSFFPASLYEPLDAALQDLNLKTAAHLVNSYLSETLGLKAGVRREDAGVR